MDGLPFSFIELLLKQFEVQRLAPISALMF